jgi:hypothetical protein
MSGFSRRQFLQAAAASLAVPSFQLVAQSQPKKWFPGHYLYTVPFGSMVGMNSVNVQRTEYVRTNPNFRGYKGLYYWASLEPTMNNYDFSMITRDLDIARSHGKKLIVQIQDRQFSTSAPDPVPAYVKTSTYGGGMYTTARGKYPTFWNANLGNRFSALFTALGAAIDDDDALSLIQIEETAMSDVQLQAGYTNTGYAESFRKVNEAASIAFPKTIFIQFVNYPGGMTTAQTDTLMHQIVNVYKNGFGGPDIFNYENRAALDYVFGKYYLMYKGIAPISHSGQTPGFKFRTAREHYDYVINMLNANFCSWVPVELSWATSPVFSIHDVIAVINAENGRVNFEPPSNVIASTEPQPFSSPTDVRLLQ